MYSSYQEWEKSVLVEDKGDEVPVILLSYSLSKDTRFSVDSEILKILEIDVQCSQSKSFDFFKLREIKVIHSRSASGCTRFSGCRLLLIEFIIKTPISYVFFWVVYVSRNCRNAPRTISPVSSVTFSIWSSRARRRRGIGGSS